MNVSNIKFCIGIAAGKGGVGKSTLTVLLAHALKKRGSSVGILDADVYGPSIPYMLGTEELPKERKGYVLPAQGNGIPYFSFTFVKEGPAAVRAPIANRVIEQCATDIDWGELDFLLVDFPPGTGDVQLTALQTLGLSGMLYVATSQEIALLDVDKAYQMGKSMDIPTVGFIENMSPLVGTNVAPFGSGKVEKYAALHKERFLGRIPLDPLVSEALDKGVNPLLSCSDEARTAMDSVVESFVSVVDRVEEPFECSLTWELMDAAKID